MKLKFSKRLRESYIEYSKLIVESSFVILSEDIEDVRGQLKKKLEKDYIEAMIRFKSNIEKELSDTVELKNSGVIKSADSLKDKLDKDKIKYVIGSLELIDQYHNEASRASAEFTKALAMGQHDVETRKELHEFLESKRKSEAVQQWSKLVDALGKSKKLINALGEKAPATLELVEGYLDILETLRDAATKYIFTLNILKQKLKLKHTAVSPDDIESDEELREQFMSRISAEIVKQFGRELTEEDQRLIDIVMDVMRGDVGVEEKKVREKMKSRDVGRTQAKKSLETKAPPARSHIDKATVTAID